MRYDHIAPAIFRSRPNRFVARVEMGQQEVICHVKNTGRCRWIQRLHSRNDRNPESEFLCNPDERMGGIECSQPCFWYGAGNARTELSERLLFRFRILRTEHARRVRFGQPALFGTGSGRHLFICVVLV